MTRTPSDLIYLDHNATTPVDSRVADAMLPFLSDHFGNPSSGHGLGQRTRSAVDQARIQASLLLGVAPEGIVFTSGGTEANNHAIIGTARTRRKTGNHIITSSVEHPAVLEVCRHLESEGFRLTVIGVDTEGRVDPQAVERAMTEDTILVSVMLANNEVGTIQPVARIAAAARRRGIWTHTDCAQAVGKIPVSREDLGVDMLSVAGHKLYAPKGIGLLALGPGIEPANLMFGAGHESGRRPGTENVLQIVGLGMACEVAAESLASADMKRVENLRNGLETALLTAHPTARIHGRGAERLPNTLSIGFPGLLAPDIIARMPLIAVSAGAACHGHEVRYSAVLEAMEVPREWALGTVRFSLGRTTTVDEVDAAVAAVTTAVRQLG